MTLEKSQSKVPAWLSRLMSGVGRMAYWVGWPGIHIILAGSKRTRIVLLADDGQCLLVKPYLGSGVWKMPGGGIRKIETPQVAATRELSEELGVYVAPNDFTSLGETAMSENGHRYHAYLLGARIEKPKNLRLQWWEVSEARWHELDAILVSIDDQELRQSLQVWAGR